MSRQTIFIIIAAVIAIHAGFFVFFTNTPALPVRASTKPQPRQNFGYEEAVFEDPRTGERTVYREIQVSTRLADPAEVEKLAKRAREQQAAETARKP